jgi:hypothetical protein
MVARMVANNVVLAIFLTMYKLLSVKKPDDGLDFRRAIFPGTGVPLDATNKTRLLIPEERRRCSQWSKVAYCCRRLYKQQSPLHRTAVAERKPFPRKGRP